MLELCCRILEFASLSKDFCTRLYCDLCIDYVFSKESVENLTESNDRVTNVIQIIVMVSETCRGGGDSGVVVLQEAPRADAPRARNASANAAAAASLFAQPGLSPVPQPLRPQRRPRGAARTRHG